MTPEELLKKGYINQKQYDDMKQTEANEAQAQEAEQWLKRVKAAPLATKKQMVKEQAVNLSIEAAIMEDTYEARAKNNKAMALRYSLRGSGGVSF